MMTTLIFTSEEITNKIFVNVGYIYKGRKLNSNNIFILKKKYNQDPNTKLN